MFNWLVLLMAEWYLLFYCIEKYYPTFFFLYFMVKMGTGTINFFLFFFFFGESRDSVMKDNLPVGEKYCK